MEPRLQQRPTRRDRRYGRGVAFGDESLHQLLDPEYFKSEIQRTFQRGEYQPPVLPDAAAEIFELVRRPDVSAKRVVHVIQRDEVLAGNVLQLARSPLFTPSGSAKLVSLNHAVVRLGLRSMRDVVAEVFLRMRVFRVPGYMALMERLRQHSVATAVLARSAGRRSPFGGDFPYLCGLFHDVGVAGMVHVLAARQPKASPELLSVLLSCVDDMHPEIGGMLMAAWGIQADVRLVVQHHHAVAVAGIDHPMAAIVCLAEHAANEAGLGFDSGGDGSPPRDRTARRERNRACATLGWTTSDLDGLIEEAQQLAESGLSDL